MKEPKPTDHNMTSIGVPIYTLYLNKSILFSISSFHPILFIWMEIVNLEFVICVKSEFKVKLIILQISINAIFVRI